MLLVGMVRNFISILYNCLLKGVMVIVHLPFTSYCSAPTQSHKWSKYGTGHMLPPFYCLVIVYNERVLAKYIPVISSCVAGLVSVWSTEHAGGALEILALGTAV